MVTYLVLNLVVMTVVLLATPSKRLIRIRAALVTGLILLVLTAVFDNLIIGFDIVDYNESKLLGVFIWKAPVEDFMYSLLAVIVLPALWHYFHRKEQPDASR